MISVQLNPGKPDDGFFDLYYFVLTPNEGLARKTVLFCAGGPGQVVLDPDPNETNAGFLSANDYNVVFFHLRGSGFSQIPPSNQYDRFLKTSYAVHDIEEIRRKFLGEDKRGRAIQWDAIIAWSYGTALAQQYAHCHPDNVGKLILIAPISRHMFKEYKESTGAFDTFNQSVREIHKQSLLNIYNSTSKEFRDEFGDLSDKAKSKIIKKLFGSPGDTNKIGIFKKAEDAFGSIPFLIDAYGELKESGDLKKSGLDSYSRKFFRKLRELRMVGSFTAPKQSTNIQSRQLDIGKALRDELLDGKKADDDGFDKYVQGSHRVYYAMGVFDGLNPTFLKEWVASGGKDIHGALRKSGGDPDLGRDLNLWLEKLGIDEDEVISPWDPAQFSHDRPTLILKGEADPVTAGGQAEYVLSNALTGPKALIEFPGIGHEFYLSNIGEDDSVWMLSGTIRFNPAGIPPGEIRAVTGTVSGRRLNEKLRITMEPPEDLIGRIEIHGYGITENCYDTENSYNVVALIENKGSQPLNLENSEWTITCQFFSGTVRFNHPSTIDCGVTQLVYGIVVGGGRDARRLYRLAPPSELEEGLEVLGFHIDQHNVVHVWFKADRDVKNAETRKWTISRGDYGITFRVTPPHPLKKGEVDKASTEADGVNFETDEELEVVTTERSEEMLKAYTPQESAEGEIPIILRNKGDEPFNARPANWRVVNPYFTATVRVNPPEIPAKGGVKVSGSIIGLKWKKWLEIKKPNELDQDIELVGFNILGEDKILLLVKNTGGQAMKSKVREWFYLDSNEDAAGDAPAKSLRMRRRLLNRLIYAFLVMDVAIFKNEKHNELFKGIREWFQQDSEKLKILPK
jgi:pimeloyl-ACP methyl ester carboxylesterase